MPRARMMLRATFSPLTTRSVSIELTESCIPMNQPLNAIRLSVAGAAQTRRKKYFSASVLTSGVQWMARKANFVKGVRTLRTRSAMARASPTLRTSRRAHSRLSPRPKAWAVRPPVPPRRK